MANNWAEARKTASNLQNFLQRLGEAEQVFDLVLAAEKEHVAVLRLISAAEKNARISQERAGKAELDATIAAEQAAEDIETEEKRSADAIAVFAEQETAASVTAAAAVKEAKDEAGAALARLKVTVAVRTEDRDNLNREIEQLTGIKNAVQSELNALHERTA